MQEEITRTEQTTTTSGSAPVVPSETTSTTTTTTTQTPAVPAAQPTNVNVSASDGGDKVSVSVPNGAGEVTNVNINRG